MRHATDLAPWKDGAVEPVARQASRELHAAGALLASSVLADSGLEHYRGAFHNRFMFLPLASAALNLVANARGAAGSSETDSARRATYAASVLIGILGAGFHFYNVGKRVGGLRWENLFYGAPLGAPAALAMSGIAGLAADSLAAKAEQNGAPKLLGLPAGRALAGFASLGLIGTIGEVGLLHFRGAFQNPFMYLPVTLPPAAAALLADAAVAPPRKRPLTKFWLRLTAALGVAGVGFHGYGVGRSMGGWRNWRQNLIDGPPLPAPPSFSGLALAGLAALALIEREAKGGRK